MDYSCYKCGESVAEGTAFCPHCNAPQIRVSVPDSSSAVPETTPTFAPGTPAEMQPPARPVSLADATGGIDWSAARKSALVGGAFVGAGSFLPLNFILMAFGGWLAVRIYNGWSERRIMSAGDGAKVGALSGVAGYVLFAIGMIVVLRFWGGQFWNWLLEAMKVQAAATGRDFKPIADLTSTPDGRVFFAVVLMIAMFMAMLLLATIGGAIGGAFARRGKRR